MGKLHELLAVESSLEKATRKLREESIQTFGKENLFKGAIKRLIMFKDEDKNSETEEHIELVTTIDENLDYLVKPMAKYWNTVLSKELTNQQAKADIVLDDGTILAKDLPATFLLGLETKLGELRKVYESIHTLAPGFAWVKDELERHGVFKNNHDTVAFKTKKDLEFIVAYDATENHPAQIEKVENTINIGKYVTTVWSGLITPLDKAERLTRIDALLQAVKKARMRANNINIVKRDKMAEALFKYING